MSKPSLSTDGNSVFVSLSLKRYTCMRFFCAGFCTDQTYKGQIIRLLSNFDFVLEFANLFEFFNI
jgi:hypothetical protein